MRRPIRIQLFLLLVFALLLYKTQKSWKRWFQEVYISLLTFLATSSLSLQPSCRIAILSLWLVSKDRIWEEELSRRSEILDNLWHFLYLCCIVTAVSFLLGKLLATLVSSVSNLKSYRGGDSGKSSFQYNHVNRVTH